MIFDEPDPYVPAWIEHGKRCLRTERPRLQSRSREIDTVSVGYQHDRDNVYRIDSTIDGYPNLRIVEREIRPEGPVYQYRLQLEGLVSASWRETGYEEELSEENWDVINLNVYTRFPAAQQWRKGSRIEMDTISGVSGSAATSKLTSPEHGLVTGQTVIPEFTAGFGGVGSGGTYLFARINANQFYLCTSLPMASVATVTPPGAPVAITGSAGSNRIAWVAHGLSDGDVVTFPALNGGSGIVAILPYYVLNSTTDDFQISLSPGGTVVALVSDITAGSTAKAGSAVYLSSDGSGMRVRPIKPGFEFCWITERRKRKARAKDYWELDLQLKGLKLEEDDSKPFKRRISTTGQTVSNDTYSGVTVMTAYQGFPPEPAGTASFSPPDLFGPGIAAEFDLPQISVTDTMVSTSPPPTALVPGFWVPRDAPQINLLSATSDDYTYHCPYGWKVLSLQSEQIPDRPLWLMSITWGYQTDKTPRTSPSS